MTRGAKVLDGIRASGTRWHPVCVVAFFAAVVTLVFLPVTLLGYTLSNAFCSAAVTGGYGAEVVPVFDPGAAASQDEAWIVLVRQGLAAGHVPFVNFNNGLGAPLLESLQPGVFYLAHPILLLLPGDGPWLFDAFSLAHVVLYLAGAYALARLHARTSFALVAAVLVGTSGLVTQHVDMIHFRAHAWAPWILWSCTRLARGDSRRKDLVVLAVAHVALVTSGALQEAFVVSLAALAVFAIEWGTRPRGERSWARPVVAGAILAASTAIASVAFVPYLAARGSGDVVTASSPLRAVQALEPYGLANVFLPHASGFTPHEFDAGGSERAMTDFHATGAWLCVLALALGFVRRDEDASARRRHRAYVVLALLGLLKLQAAWPFAFLAHVPFVSEILFVKYHGWIFDTCVILVATALESHARLSATEPARARRLVAWTAVSTAVVALVLVGGTWAQGIARAGFTRVPDVIASLPEAVRRDMAWTYGAAIAAFLACVALLMVRPRGTAAILLAIAVAQGALVRPNGWLPRLPRYTGPSGERVADDRSDPGGATLRLSAYPPNQNAIVGLRSVGVFDPVCNTRLRSFLNHTFPLTNREFILQPEFPGTRIDARRLAALRFLGVGVVEDFEVDPGAGLVRDATRGVLVPEPLPRVWLLDEGDARRLAEWTPRTRIEDRVDEVARALAKQPRVTDVREVGNGLEFRAPADFRGRLVVQQAWSHAWRFRGEEGTPFSFLYPSWSVEWKSGEMCRIDYHPRGLTLALVAGGLGCVLLAMVLFAGTNRWRA